ncbi:hypothetical protein [Rossellomorea marisflavi]|uniref:hypothetical protein n=1 Tax=Rossellomorea marisflavi TaxID=189381 RepID=UPI003FA09ACE
MIQIATIGTGDDIVDAEGMYFEILKLKKIISAYESFEGDIEYALSKVQNFRVEEALEVLRESLREINE